MSPRVITAFAAAGFAVAVCGGILAGMTPACGIPESKLEKGAADFCKARAAYKLIALAAGGALDPKPGSPRAVLEAEEDTFCANLPKPDGGQ